jgi:hypothetical protein
MEAAETSLNGNIGMVFSTDNLVAEDSDEEYAKQLEADLLNLDEEKYSEDAGNEELRKPPDLVEDAQGCKDGVDVPFKSLGGSLQRHERAVVSRSLKRKERPEHEGREGFDTMEVVD